ncbi:MAG: isocitrate/isopropylmalate family dehydrogenase [Gaiellaceae bacterium MAG52_C11]|nr:isocitrate/isopropylmalate family dehydrogenase [Candidatus Gaiellasilicea maunaloa]
MTGKRYTLACIAGHGVGPELVAATSRAVAAASRLHGFEVEQEFVPFGVDALMRYGHPYPNSSRGAVLAADVVLVAPGVDGPLDAIEAELDLRASITRVRYEGRCELSIVAPLHNEAWQWTLDRAFDIARASRARVTLVGVPAVYEADTAAAEAAHPGFQVERMPIGAAMSALVTAPRHFDVVVVPPDLATSVAAVAACTAPNRIAAWGRLAENGPSIFGTSHDDGHDHAGHGVADPAPLLLAAALTLGDGLGERSAADTLARAVGQTRTEPRDVSTRGATDAVLAELPRGLAFEFVREAS